MAGEGVEGVERLDADRGAYPRPNVATLSAMALGERGRTAGIVVSEAVWVGVRDERRMPPDRPEGRGQGDLPARDVYRLPRSQGWRGARAEAAEGTGRAIAPCHRHPRGRGDADASAGAD